MLFTDFIGWWYGPGWLLRWSSISRQLSHWAQFFSLGTLLKTLFAPWHQIITPKGPDRPLQDIVKGWLDNAVSRFVGFWVRLIVFFAGLFMLTLVAVMNLLFAVAWPLLPILPIAILIIGAL